MLITSSRIVDCDLYVKRCSGVYQDSWARCCGFERIQSVTRSGWSTAELIEDGCQLQQIDRQQTTRRTEEEFSKAGIEDGSCYGRREILESVAVVRTEVVVMRFRWSS